MKQFRHIKFLFLFLTVIAFKTAAQQDCVFNVRYKTENPVQKNTIFKDYQWNPSSSELFGNLKEGGFIYVKKWSCNHLGMDARFISFYSPHGLNDQQYWLNKSLWFAAQLLDPKDYAILKENISKQKYQISNHPNKITLTLTSDIYSIYQITITEQDYMTVVAIYYYID